MKSAMLMWSMLVAASTALAQAQPPKAVAPAAAATLSDHAKKDVTRHRAMAAAHDAAAKCLESGREYDQCLKDLQAACKGLGIGKYCGMRHEH